MGLGDDGRLTGPVDVVGGDDGSGTDTGAEADTGREVAGMVPWRPDELRGPPEVLARRLVGAVLWRAGDGGTEPPVVARVVEVEAYGGPGQDPASHAHRGPRPRNRSMFARPGSVYVYRSYGIHWCANVVVHDARPGDAGAVLLRAAEILGGRAVAARRRGDGRPERDLARGPGRLCTALAISGTDDGADVCAPQASLRLLHGVAPARLMSGPRVGVSAPGAETPWRWWDPDSPHVSPYRRARPPRR